ncbi:MAG: SGNH/GDSL hydrolase family protein [Deltaproteobacteria bacterium]|nr:SGNH/GDSL hydrolase family protein [Deltaproteobacteria bacterium]
MAEHALRLMHRQGRSLPDYGDTMRQGLGRGGYLQENLSTYVTDGLGGKVRWTNNSAGFRSDREFSEARPPGALRILSLGDSFTAGYRVGQEETFSYLQEQWLNQKGGRSEILVAEIEDPVTALYYLDRFGIKFNPDMILLGITLGNDITQSYWGLDPKGGFVLGLGKEVSIDINKKPEIGFRELLVYQIPPAYLVPRKEPGPVDRLGAWLKKRYLLRRFFQQHEPIISWAPRDPPSLFDLVNGFGVFTNPAPPLIDEAYRRLFRVLTAFQILCQKRDILFAVQLFPQRYQVQPDDWERAVSHYGLRSSRFDVMAPNKRIGDFCKEKGINCIDPTAAMAADYARNGKSLYLPRGEMHWNRAGQRAFFQCSREAFTALVQQGFQLAKARDAGSSPSKAISP